MSHLALIINQVYFEVLFVDEALTKPVVQSFEYLGRVDEAYEFQALDPFAGTEGGDPPVGVYAGTILLTEVQATRLVDLPGLIAALMRIAKHSSDGAKGR